MQLSNWASVLSKHLSSAEAAKVRTVSIDGVFAGYLFLIRAGSDVLLFNFMKGWK